MSEKIEKRGGANRNQGRHAKNWKPLNLKIDADLSDFLDSLCVKKGDKTRLIEILINQLKLKIGTMPSTIVSTIERYR